MEDSIGQIDYGSNSNSIVMRILRSAMDTAHEKLRFKDGPIEFLHEQTTFYELAAILVKGCLEIVEDDESEILESSSSSKILTDLIEIRQWLVERTRDMKQLIREKDREYRERFGLRERETAYMYEEIEPGVMKNTVHEHQVLNVEQKSEDENMILNTKRRGRRSRASCPNFIPRCLSKESRLVLLEDEKTVLNTERRVRRSHSVPNLSSDSLDKQQGIVLFDDENMILNTKKRGRRSHASCPNFILRCLSKESRLVLLEDEKTVLNTERRVRRSHSDPNLSSDSLDKQQGIVLFDDENMILNTKRRGRRSHASCPNFILRCLSKESRLVLLEDEKTVLNTERRVRRSHSDPNLSSDSLDKQQGILLLDDKRRVRSRYASSPDLSPSSLNKQQIENDEYMSSQMDILKRTLDLVFERTQLTDVLPLEKEWRRGVEREVESLLFKGFVCDLEKKFDIELKTRDKLVNDSWFDFIDEMKSLFHELKDFFSRHDLSSMQSYPAGARRTSSEPNLDVDFTQNLIQNDDDEVCGSPRVWEIVKSHESIIQKQREQWNMLTKDALQREAMLSWIKRNEEINAMERLIQDAIVRLENFAQRKHKVSDLKCVGCRNRAQEKRRRRIPKPHRRIDRTSTAIQTFEAEIKKLQEERDGLWFQISVIEDTYQLLFRGVMKDFSMESCCREKETASDEAEGSDTNQILMHYMESAVKDDIFVLVLHEMVKQWKMSRYGPVRGSKVPQGEICYGPVIIEEYTESHLREEIYMIYFKEMIKSLQEETIEHRKVSQADSIRCSKTPQEDFHFSLIHDCTECLLREDIYKVYLREMTKGWRPQEPKHFYLEAQMPQEGMPSSRGADGESSSINKDCEETEEQNTIEWLISDDDETTFCSVSEKLERSLQQLHTSKELLAEIEEDLELSDGGEEYYENSQFSNMLRIQEEKTSPELKLEAVAQKFRFLVDNVEVELHENLENKFLRLEALKRQVHSLSQPVTWIRTRKLLYEKAFISRCRNLKLAETEVDLLGDQVEALLSLLERVYFALSRDAKVLSNYFEVHDILKLIKIELSGGRSSRAKS